jgi:hypothetical protein
MYIILEMESKKSWSHLQGEERWKARQANAYKTYYEKHKESEEFKEKRRLAQKKYYMKNKEKVIARVKAKQAQKKEQDPEYVPETESSNSE